MAIGGNIGAGAARPKGEAVAFGNHIIAVLGLATVAIGGKVGSGAAYNCCPGPGWPSWPLVGKSAEATVAIGGKIGAGAGRPLPSVAFGNHIIAVLGLAGHRGHWWENRLRPLWPLVGKSALARARCHPSLSETI